MLSLLIIADHSIIVRFKRHDDKWDTLRVVKDRGRVKPALEIDAGRPLVPDK